MSKVFPGKCPILYLDECSDDQFFFHKSTLRTETPFHIQQFFSAAPVLAYLKGEAPFNDRMVYPWPAFILCDYIRANQCHDLVASIRAIPSCKTLPVILFSGAISDHRLASLYGAGADHFLDKPSFPRLEIIVQALYRCATSEPMCFDSLQRLKEYRAKPICV